MKKLWSELAVNQSLPRRSFLLSAAGAATATCLSPNLLLASYSEPNHASSIAADVMEQALERMVKLAPLGNHGPMAVEALITLGCAEEVSRWIDGYEKRFTRDSPAPREKVTSANWRAALGDYSRVADWAAFFRAELKEAAWPQVVEKWVAHLAPGLAASAAHGIIRTGHAVRSLSIRESEGRRHELAEGLAYWAATYLTFPDSLNAKAENLKLTDALSRVPHLPDEKRKRGSVTDALASLNQLPEFAVVGNLLALPASASQFLSEVTETFAAVYLKNVHDRNAIGLVHAITGATAIRSLLPYLSPTTTRSVMRYGWQLVAGIYSVYTPALPHPLSTNGEIKRDELIGRAVAAQDEHAIKVTEACLREYALNAKPVYLQAAQDAVMRFRIG